MGKGDKKRREMTPFSLTRLDREDCRRCRGSGYVVDEDPQQPGVYDLKLCPAGCVPENPMTELRIPSSVQPLSGIFQLKACLGDESQTIYFPKKESCR